MNQDTRRPARSIAKAQPPLREKREIVFGVPRHIGALVKCTHAVAPLNFVFGRFGALVTRTAQRSVMLAQLEKDDSVDDWE